jgi:hypothetical protein
MPILLALFPALLKTPTSLKFEKKNDKNKTERHGAIDRKRGVKTPTKA